MDELIVKYLQGNCSDSEKKTLFLWVEKSPENLANFKHMRQLWTMNLLIAPENAADQKTDEAYQSVARKLETKRPLKKPVRYLASLARYAAVAIFCFGLSWFVWEQTNKPKGNNWQTVEVPVGQRVKLTLADGSLIWLNSKSQFRYSQNYAMQNRTVQLNGEAYFEVAHNSKMPFIVKTRKAFVTVKGTKFNLYAYDNEPSIETTLIEGKVDFSENRDNGINKSMLPNEQLIYNADSRKIEIFPEINTEVVTSWVKGTYFFNNVTLKEMVRRLTHYYNVRFEVKSDSILDYSCTGKFRIDEPLDEVLKVISTSRPFKYKILEDRVIIYE